MIMSRWLKKRSGKTGLSPGSLVHIGERLTESTKITVLNYDEAHIEEKEVSTASECWQFKDRPTVTWIHINGIHDVKALEELGTIFSLHPLTQEDILNSDQRPKMEDFGDYLFIVLKMITYNGNNGGLDIEQVSLILGRNSVLSFQEGKAGDVFGPLRERLRTAKGRIRKMGADYLVYSLMDSIVDNYFVVLENLGEEIEVIEEKLMTEPVP